MTSTCLLEIYGQMKDIGVISSEMLCFADSHFCVFPVSMIRRITIIGGYISCFQFLSAMSLSSRVPWQARRFYNLTSLVPCFVAGGITGQERCKTPARDGTERSIAISSR